MNFFIKDHDLLKKYNDIRNKVSNNIKNQLDCEPIYNKNFFENQNKVLKSGLKVMRLHIFKAEKYRKQALIIFVGQ